MTALEQLEAAVPVLTARELRELADALEFLYPPAD